MAPTIYAHNALFADLSVAGAVRPCASRRDAVAGNAKTNTWPLVERCVR